MKKTTPERKAALTQLCDADSYEAIILSSVDPEIAKAHNPKYLANILANIAEAYLIHYEKIGFAFCDNEELAVTFNCKLSKGNADVEIAFLPVAKFKDTVKSHFETDGQPDLGDIKNQAKSRAPKPVKAVKGRLLGVAADDIPMEAKALPAPVIEVEIVANEMIIDEEDEGESEATNQG